MRSCLVEDIHEAIIPKTLGENIGEILSLSLSINMAETLLIDIIN